MTDSRFTLPADADERTLLTGFLDYQRNAFRANCAGLTDEQLRQRAVPTSTLTLLGLMRHLAGVERWYFQTIIAAASPTSLFAELGDDFSRLDDTTGPETLAMWEAEVATSRDIAASLPLDHVGHNPSRGIEQSLRWVMHHMIDEYARHNGHADLIREALDGKTGETKASV